MFLESCFATNNQVTRAVTLNGFSLGMKQRKLIITLLKFIISQSEVTDLIWLKFN